MKRIIVFKFFNTTTKKKPQQKTIQTERQRYFSLMYKSNTKIYPACIHMLIDYKPKGLLHASNEFQNFYMTSK